MGYKILDHRADIRILVESNSIQGLFQDALQGTMHILQSKIKATQTIQRDIKLISPDPTALLIDFLNQALLLAETKKEAYHQVEFKKLTQTQLNAKLIGYPVKSFEEDIKAVTYHEAAITKNKKGHYQTSIVYDI